MQRHQNQRARACELRRGAAAVEFAVLVPLFLMLVMGTWEMGTALTAGTKMSAAVREGGRLASMDFTDTLIDGETINAKVEKDIKNFLTASGIPAAVTSPLRMRMAKTKAKFRPADTDNYLEMFGSRPWSTTRTSAPFRWTTWRGNRWKRS
jgi:Flp pilus assembly protein TadG